MLEMSELIRNNDRNETDKLSYNKQMRARTVIEAYEQLTPNELAYFSAIIPEIGLKKKEDIIQRDDECIDAIIGWFKRKLRK